MKCKKCGYEHGEEGMTHENAESPGEEMKESVTESDSAAKRKPTDLEPELDSAQSDPAKGKKKEILKMGIAKSLSKKIGQ